MIVRSSLVIVLPISAVSLRTFSFAATLWRLSRWAADRSASRWRASGFLTMVARSPRSCSHLGWGNGTRTVLVQPHGGCEPAESWREAPPLHRHALPTGLTHSR